MTEIPFTQYKLPNGQPVPVAVNRPDHITAKAQEIIAAGYRFECEVLMSGQISLTITDDDADHAIEVVDNGPDVPKAVDRLVSNFQPGEPS